METSDAQVTRHLSDISLAHFVIFALVPLLIKASLSIQVVFGAVLEPPGQLVSLSSATLLLKCPFNTAFTPQHQSRVGGQG